MKRDKKGRFVKKNKVGPPTKYIPDVIYPKIEDYLSSCGREQTSLPSVGGLALHLGVNRDTVFEWAKKYKELSDYLKKLADKQRQQLMDDGMYGGKEVNAGMAIFLLKAIHKMSEQPTTAVQVNVFTNLNKKDNEFIEGEEAR